MASFVRARHVCGVSLGGLITQAQPAARAGPTLRVIMAAGKFHLFGAKPRSASKWAWWFVKEESLRGDDTADSNGLHDSHDGGIGCRRWDCVSICPCRLFRKP